MIQYIHDENAVVNTVNKDENEGRFTNIDMAKTQLGLKVQDLEVSGGLPRIRRAFSMN